MATDYLGEFEHLVLLAVHRLGDSAYGVTIRRVIAERANRAVSFGAVYSTLRRLRAKGLVELSDSVPHPSVVGRPRQFFRITDRGVQTVLASQRRLQSMADGLPGLPLAD